MQSILNLQFSGQLKIIYYLYNSFCYSSSFKDPDLVLIFE